MKKQFSTLRNIALAISFSGAMLCVAAPSFAAGNNIEIISNESSFTPAVKLVNTDAAGSTFLVKVDAASPVKFEVSIKDKSGAVLFTQAYEAADFAKPFKILNDDYGNLNSTITVKALADGTSSTFNVSSNDKIVTEVAIKKS